MGEGNGALQGVLCGDSSRCFTQTAVMCNSPHVLQKTVWQAVDNIEQQAQEGDVQYWGCLCSKRRLGVLWRQLKRRRSVTGVRTERRCMLLCINAAYEFGGLEATTGNLLRGRSHLLG